MEKSDWSALQMRIARDGFDPGVVDGIPGPVTLKAFREWVRSDLPAEASIIPLDWMPPARMARIVFHWTAGTHKASDFDRKAYHLLIEGDGSLVRGHHGIDENAFPIDRRSYAAHVADANTGSIGVSLCAMAGAKERPLITGPYPITEDHLDALIAVMATLCATYDIPVTRQTVLSHAEVEPTLGIKQRNKWDIMWIPGMERAGDPITIGDAIREQVREAMR